LQEAHNLASKEDFSIKVFADTTHEFVEFMNQVVKDHDNFKSDAAVEQVKVKLSKLAAQVFSKREWPDTLWPMGDMKMKLAELYQSYGNHPQAVSYAIKGCLAKTRRSGPRWVDDLHQLLQFLVPVMASEQEVVSVIGPAILSDRQLWDFFHGLLHEMMLQTKKTYGTDTIVAKAITKWYSDAMASADKPLPGQAGFYKRFDAAQSKVLLWAEVDVSRRVVLSSSRRS
jgi:hypothetical protein